MKPHVKLLFIIVVLIFNQACNTLYNFKTINIEILEPAKVKLPHDYENVAIRYNNVNVAWNPLFANYNRDAKILTDSTNLDSLASFEYFRQFSETLKNQEYFDKVNEIKAADYSHTEITDSINIEDFSSSIDMGLMPDDYSAKISILKLLTIFRNNPPNPTQIENTKDLNPDYGFYSKKEIQTIRDTTGADILLSLDFFYTLNGRTFDELLNMTSEIVFVNYFWTAYDLQKLKPAFSIVKRDTISWDKFHDTDLTGITRLPDRKDAVMNAAYIAGTNTTKYLIPHWVEVERLYYQTGQVDLKPANKLVEEGKWTEAAKLWKQQVNSPNKMIAAKCMYNMAVACEMNDQLEAALEWAVKSYHVFGEKNEVHASNCREYIQILGQRKVDKSLIDLQSDNRN